jgi:hypothetical protein
MQNFVPKRPGIQSDMFTVNPVTIVDREDPKLHVGVPVRQRPQPVDVPPAVVYDARLVDDIVRAYIRWQG